MPALFIQFACLLWLQTLTGFFKYWQRWPAYPDHYDYLVAGLTLAYSVYIARHHRNTWTFLTFGCLLGLNMSICGGHGFHRAHWSDCWEDWIRQFQGLSP